MRRRDFLATALAGAGGLLLPRGARAGAGTIRRKASAPLRVLVLGGTNFVGPEVVRLALDRGHQVTLFNRGITHPWLFTHLERLVGDRYPDRGDGLRALHGDRRWDAVVDTWQGSPVCVQKTAELLADRVGYYAYVSSIAVYQGENYRRDTLHEELELPPVAMPESWTEELPYPQRKQLGERAVAESFRGRHGAFRAYGIAGTDARGRLDVNGGSVARAAYWPVRLRGGGEVLAPGTGDDVTQWTDVRDLADFLVHSIENRLAGTFNVSAQDTMKGFLKQLADLSPAGPILTWVPAEVLFDAGLSSFVDIPGWVSHAEVEHGFYRASTRRAREAGFHPRTAAETFRPVIDAFLRHHADVDLGNPEDGVALARREREVLAMWREHRSSAARPNRVRIEAGSQDPGLRDDHHSSPPGDHGR